jgi:cell division septation protein DedD
VEAGRVERRLAEAGYAASVARRRVGGTVYAVLIDNVPSEVDARALAAGLRAQGFAESTVTGAGDAFTVRVGAPAPLRFAIELAERLKANGHRVRVAAETGEAVHYTVRQGRYADPSEAERKSQEIQHLGLTNAVVRIK